MFEEHKTAKNWVHIDHRQIITVSRALCEEFGFIVGDYAMFKVVYNEKERLVGILFVMDDITATHVRKVDRRGLRTTIRPVLSRFDPKHATGHVPFTVYDKAEPGAHLVFKV